MKPPRQLEYRTLNLLESLAAGRPLEDVDSQAALFPSWPGPARAAARRLAAHGNAARGRDLLWLIGLRRDGSGPGADLRRFNDWLAGIVPFFDGVPPRVTAFGVPMAAQTGKAPAKQVVALHVETDRAPFVVRPSPRSPALEVPWLDHADAAIRAAGRIELVKLLSPLQDLPGLEILEGDLTFYRNPHPSYSSKAAFRWTFDGALYVMPRTDTRLVIPLHRCRAGVAASDGSFSTDATEVNLSADQHSPAIRFTESAALVEGLGRMFVYCCGSTTQPEIPLQHALSILIDLIPTGSDRAATALSTLRPALVTEGNQAGRWKL